MYLEIEIQRDDISTLIKHDKKDENVRSMHNICKVWGFQPQKKKRG